MQMKLNRSPTGPILTVLLTAPLLAGCPAPGPAMFPPSPLAVKRTPTDLEERLYDLTGDGRPDYRERLGTDGRIALLRFDDDGDGADLEDVSWPQRDAADLRHLVLILDSIPFDMVNDAWRNGRFRLFFPPSPTISPFPVMTDVSLSAFFGVLPSLAVESEYYDGKRLNDPYATYAKELVAGPWLAYTDYHLNNVAHAFGYLAPEPWYDHELGRIQRRFLRSKKSPYVAYLMGPSALGAHQGRNGHLTALVRLDRTCQAIVHRLRGRVQITLMSDHGHNLVPSRRIPLADVLARCGYRVRSRLRDPADVVVPEFGVTTYAGIYTLSPARVARDVAGIEGVDFTTYLDANDEVVIVGRRGVARIASNGAGFRYQCESGDPVRLLRIVESLTATNAVDRNGFVNDRALRRATKDHDYPDPLHRLWRAFHGQTVHTPDVIVSIRDGWHCGSRLQSALVDVQATHGNLGRASTCGFVMSTAGRVDDMARMEDLAGALRAIGVPVPGAKANDNADESVTGASVTAVGPLTPPLRNGVIEQLKDALPGEVGVVKPHALTDRAGV